MNSHAAQPIEPAADRSVSALNVLVLYEDFLTALRGKHSLELVPRKLHLDQKFTTQLWRWDLLRDPARKDQAVVEAGSADIILLSAHGKDDLPLEVQNWLQQCLSDKRHRWCAIGVLLDREAVSSGSNRVLTFLKRLAHAGGVDFFCGFDDSTGPQSAGAHSAALN